MSAHRSTSLYVMLHSILHFHLQYNSPLPPPYQPSPHKNSSSLFFFSNISFIWLELYVYLWVLWDRVCMIKSYISYTQILRKKFLNIFFPYLRTVLFAYLFSFTLTKLFNHYDYPHFYSLSSERLSTLLKIIKLENVWTHQGSTYTCETPKFLSSHSTGFLHDEWSTLESLMYQYLARSCLRLPFKGWATITRIKLYINSHTSWFKKNFWNNF